MPTPRDWFVRARQLHTELRAYNRMIRQWRERFRPHNGESLTPRQERLEELLWAQRLRNYKRPKAPPGIGGLYIPELADTFHQQSLIMFYSRYGYSPLRSVK
jgi:hypothetical protein